MRQLPSSPEPLGGLWPWGECGAETESVCERDMVRRGGGEGACYDEVHRLLTSAWEGVRRLCPSW